MASLVIATPDVVGARMAGPGIRAYHFARELARHYPTTLVADLKDLPSEQPFRTIQRGTAEARRALRQATVVVGQPTRELLSHTSRKQKLVFDLFSPVVLELDELYGARPTIRQSIHRRLEWHRLRRALVEGDLLIAAARRQTEFYGRVYEKLGAPQSGWGERWVEVGFGIEERWPSTTPIRIDDDPRPLIVWGGGAWSWLDPELAIEAVGRLNQEGVECRLLFLGAVRPNSRAAGSVTHHARLMRLNTKDVVWNSNWVPYEERDRWLRACKLAIMLHRRTVESEFSIRTRLFDAIWCSLPVVATEGGLAADLVRLNQLGYVVPPSDVYGVMVALDSLLRDDGLYEASVSHLEALRPRFLWPVVVRPLIEAVRNWME